MSNYFLNLSKDVHIHPRIIKNIYFLAEYLALAGLNLLAQLSDRIHSFTALSSVMLESLVSKANGIRLETVK